MCDFHHGKRIVITILVCGHDVVIIMHKEGDALLIQQPVYYPFREVIEDNGRIFVNNQLHYEDGKYTIDFEDFEKKIVDNNVKYLSCAILTTLLAEYGQKKNWRKWEISA